VKIRVIFDESWEILDQAVGDLTRHNRVMPPLANSDREGHCKWIELMEGLRVRVTQLNWALITHLHCEAYFNILAFLKKAQDGTKDSGALALP
jgi:hypothetical protein